MKRSTFQKEGRQPLKRTPLARVSKNRVKKIKIAGFPTVTEIKKEIQATLREIVILRDKKCILHGIRCYNFVGIEGVVWQAEHLVERSNSATYSDTRLVVLVCKNCHGWKHFKKSNHDQYDEWVRTKISKERIAHWDKCKEANWRPSKIDWKIELICLKSELKVLQVTK